MPNPSSAPRPAESPVTVEYRTNHSCLTKWAIPYNSKLKPKKTINSPYFEVGGFDFRFLLYPKGDSMASPGYLSLYIEINDPRCSSKFDCFASYKLSILNHEDKSNSLTRESYYRFSFKKKTIGWGDFGLATSVFDPKSGFFKNGSLLVSVEISILDESVSFSRDNNNNEVEYSVSSLGCNSLVLNGKFTWKVKNFSLFKEMIKTQKIVSPDFQVGEVVVHIKVYKTKVNGVGCLSLFLEASEAHKCAKCATPDKSSWCLFRISVLNQRPGLNHMHRDSYGRFNEENSNGDDTTLGWTDYLKILDFIGSDKGFVVDDTVVFTVSFNAIKDSIFTKSAGLRNFSVIKKCDSYMGKYTWKIENFSRLKDVLKKKKMKGVFAKSRKFRIGNHEFRLVVYPRGLSQKPFYLSMFLEVLDPRNPTTDWSCYACYQLSIVNQKMKDNSILKESRARCSKATKEWGWSEFVTLTSLFDKDSGYVVQDTVIFGAQVLILKETFKLQDLPESSNKPAHKDGEKKRWSIIWKVENFLSFKRILASQSMYSKYFQVDQLELRIGVNVFSDFIYAYLECDPSVLNDPDKDFWVSYRMTLVNQKHPAKSFWKESSLFTKTRANCDLQFMKLSDMLEADAGFVMGEMVTFVCEILDYCPWFDFSELEVLGDVTPTELQETTCSESCDVMNGYNVDISRQLLATARDHLSVEDNTSLILVILKEELKNDLFTLAGILIGMRLYLDNPIKQNNFFHQLSGCIDTGQIDLNPDKFLSKLTASITDADFLRQKIDNALLDVMVECCQRLNRKSGEDPHDASSKPFLDTNEASPQTKFHWRSRLANFLRSYERFFGIDNCMDNCSNTSRKAILGQHDSTCKSSEEILGFIVNSLKALDDNITQDTSKPSQGCQFVEKILVLLNEAPRHLLPDLVSLLPKLACQLDHKVVACALLDQLEMPGAESSMRLPVLEAMSQLQLGIDVWERAFCQASEVVIDLNGEALGAAICLLFKAASQCQHIPQAVSIVHQSLESQGAEVSPCVLDLLRKTLNTSGDLAVTMLRKIDSVFSLDQKHLTNGIRPSSSGENGLTTKSLHTGVLHFSDIFMLLEMLAIPSIAVQTTQVFEKGIANGFITYHLVEMVLEKCASVLGVHLVSSEEHQSGNTETAGKGSIGSLYTEEVFKLVFVLADKLFLSRHSRVHGFLRKFYSILYRLFAGENYQKKMLRRLVDHAISAANNCSETSLDVLVFLVQKECKAARLVLSMIRDDIQLANSDLSALQSQLRAREDEYSCAEEELQTELSKMRIEKLTLLERLHESDAVILHYKSEMRLEMDHSTREKKELSEQLEEVKRQFQHTCSKQNDRLEKLSNEKKVYQDHLRGLETQLSQLKSQKHQELKVEAQEAVQWSLLGEVQKLKQNLGQIKREKQEKEEEVAHCKTYIDELKVELNNCQQYIRSLQVSLKEELLRQAPLYGYGLENLSMKELEILSSIHEDGLRKIHAIQHRIRSDSDSLPPSSKL
ncbi:uncharacterized protein LOC111284647 isoform X2 [Durio zibethinus]|uniref:Uncharacterized protein LOC111284647 isoform X2 n=1 Tax=Durio zibethinus TaxID=66656 RepID=A0A6P5XLF8_DURZI|nr:uncharacterized protein LOC111284647 isoform X2 [Durio zibethinus]